MRKLRHFQQLGHTVIFLIGDSTALIGDPTGKNVTRKPLTREEIDANAETYKRRSSRSSTATRPRSATTPSGSTKLGYADMIKLAAKATVSQMLEREDFHKRFNAEQPISLHELLYPLAQGYDSVALECDVELGGTDQKFNLLRGPRPAARRRPAAADRPDDADPRRPRRRAEDVEVAGQRHRQSIKTRPIPCPDCRPL
jgi:tyrosyl-tRNA synthetase